MPLNETTAPPTYPILMWDVGGVEHNGGEAWEVCIVLQTEFAADAWKAWLKQVSPGKDYDVGKETNDA